jgi:hypothetical protein
MDRYIGMDVHAASCTLCIVGPSGRKLASSVVEDALGLAQALRLNTIERPVFKAPSQFARLPALATTYDQIARDVTRTQTRIKALFRARGIPTQGQTVYNKKHRQEWQSLLPEVLHSSVELLWQERARPAGYPSRTEIAQVRERALFIWGSFTAFTSATRRSAVWKSSVVPESIAKRGMGTAVP